MGVGLGLGVSLGGQSELARLYGSAALCETGCVFPKVCSDRGLICHFNQDPSMLVVNGFNSTQIQCVLWADCSSKRTERESEAGQNNPVEAEGWLG